MDFLFSEVEMWHLLMVVAVFGLWELGWFVFGKDGSDITRHMHSECDARLDALERNVNRLRQASVNYDVFWQLEKRVCELHQRDWHTRLKRWIDKL